MKYPTYKLKILLLLFLFLFLELAFSQTNLNYKSNLETSNVKFRSELNSIFQTAAKNFGIRVNTSTMIYKVVRFRAGSELSESVKSMIIINTALEGVENITIDKLNKGADILLTFLQLPEGSELNSGFYRIFVSKDPKGREQYVAQFIDMNGKVVLQKPTTIKEVNTASKGVHVRVTVGIKPGKPPTIEIDIEIEPKEPPQTTRALHIVTSFNLGEKEIQVLPSNEIYKKILESTNNYIKEVDNTFLQISKAYKITLEQSWESLSISDNIFTIYTVFDSVNKLTINDFSKEQDFFLGYLPDLEDQNIPAGLYKVSLYQKSGNFYAQLQEISSLSKNIITKTILKPLADRVIIEPMPAETKSGFYGGIYFDEKLGKRIIEINYLIKSFNYTNKGAFIINPKMDSG
ncbi:MAG: hypothetical protein QXU71_03065 [Candidatus Aenigmatarchaeota archaeon]